MKLTLLTALLVLVSLKGFANPYIQDLPNPLETEPSLPAEIEVVTSVEEPSAEPTANSTPTPEVKEDSPPRIAVIPVPQVKPKEVQTGQTPAPVLPPMKAPAKDARPAFLPIGVGMTVYVVSSYGPLPAKVINLANGGRFFVEFTGPGYKGKRDHVEGRHVAQLSGCLKGHCVGEKIRDAKIVSIYPRMNSLIVQYTSGKNKGRFDRWNAAQF